MRILIIAIHYPVCSARYAADALRRLGHDVRTDGPTTGDAIWGIQVDARHAWVAAPPEAGWSPELVILMDSGLAVNRRWSCLVVVYGVDNHVRDYAQFDGVADHFFLAHGDGYRMGEANVSWLPCGYDPVWFRPGPPWLDRDWDAALIGVLYGARTDLLRTICTRLPQITLRASMGLLYGDYAAIYQQARLSLVCSAAGDVAQRVWETAAMGCLLLMDACPDASALGLVDGVNCLVYHSLDEAADRVQWALDHPDEAAEIAWAGQAWAAPGTWDARLSEIVRWAEGR